MNCERIEQLLPFLHDGTLERSVAREAARHIKGCSRCAEAYAELSLIVNLTRDTLRARPLPAMTGYVGEVRERIRKRAHARTLFRLAVPAAAAIFLAVSVGTYTLFLDNAVKYRSPHTATTHVLQSPALSSHAVTVDENTLINAMYHYSDVTLDDFVSRMDEGELEEVLKVNER